MPSRCLQGRNLSMHFETTVEVNAPAGKLWQAVADVEKGPDWTASTRDVRWQTDGKLRRGGPVRIRQPGMPPPVWEGCNLEPGSSFPRRTTDAGGPATGIPKARPAD